MSARRRAELLDLRRRAELVDLALEIRAEIRRLDRCSIDLCQALATGDRSMASEAAKQIYVCDLEDKIEAFRARETKP